MRPVRAASPMVSTTPVGKAVIDGNLELHFWHVLHGVFGPAIDLGLALLPPEAAHLGDGQPLHANGGERLAHRVDTVRLDDCNDIFHGARSPIAFCRRILPVLKKSPRGIENVDWLEALRQGVLVVIVHM